MGHFHQLILCRECGGTTIGFFATKQEAIDDLFASMSQPVYTGLVQITATTATLIEFFRTDLDGSKHNYIATYVECLLNCNSLASNIGELLDIDVPSAEMPRIYDDVEIGIEELLRKGMN